MSSRSDISYSLIQAYQTAVYRIHSSPECILKAAEISECAHELLIKHHASSATILTAFNPYSNLLSNEINLARHHELLLHIKRLGITYLDASGEDQIGNWKPERGYCLFNLGKARSVEMAKIFEQNAYIFIDSSGLVSLELTR